MAKSRFSKSSLQSLLESKIESLREEFDLPHPYDDGLHQIKKIKLSKKHPKHSEELRIYVWGQITGFYEIIEHIND